MAWIVFCDGILLEQLNELFIHVILNCLYWNKYLFEFVQFNEQKIKEKNYILYIIQLIDLPTFNSDQPSGPVVAIADKTILCGRQTNLPHGNNASVIANCAGRTTDQMAFG